MNSIDTWLNAHLEGSLTDEQSMLFADEVARNPEAYQQTAEQLDLVDLIEQILSPDRSDEAFLSQLSTALDQVDGGDFGDGGDGSDGGGDGPTDLPGPDGGFSPDLIVDPGVSGGLSTGAKIWTVAALSVGIGAGVTVMKLRDEPAPIGGPGKPTEPLVAAPNHSWIDIIAEAGEGHHAKSKRHTQRSNVEDTLFVHGVLSKNQVCWVMLRFDLSALPDDYERVELRLTAASADDGATPLGLSVMSNDAWNKETFEKHAPELGALLGQFVPIEGKTTAMNVTRAVIQEKAKDGKISFLIAGSHWPKPEIGYHLYSGKHENKAYRPTLRVYPKAE